MNLLFVTLFLVYIKCNDYTTSAGETDNEKLQKLKHCEWQRHAMITLKKAAKIYWKEAKKDENFYRILMDEVIIEKIKSDYPIYKFWLQTVLNQAFQNWTTVKDENLKVFQFIRSNAKEFYNIIQNIGQFIDLRKKHYRHFIIKLVKEIAKSHKETVANQLPEFDNVKIKWVILKASIVSAKIKQQFKTFSLQDNSVHRKIDYKTILDEIKDLEEDNRFFGTDLNSTICYSKHNAIQYLYSDLKFKSFDCNKKWINCYKENYNFVQRLGGNQLIE